MSHDTLQRTLIVIMLGDHVHAEALADKLEESRSVIGTAHMRHLKIRWELGEPQQKLACLIETASECHFHGKPIVFVTGFPQTEEEAQLLTTSCPHLMVFSLEGANEIAGQPKILAILKRRSRVYHVDLKRSRSSQQSYIDNRIEDLLRGVSLEQTLVPA